jgi:hypothetical protein
VRDVEPDIDTTLDVRLAGDDARRARALSMRLGMQPAGVVRLALHVLATGRGGEREPTP